jgi:hypothetical protein
MRDHTNSSSIMKPKTKSKPPAPIPQKPSGDDYDLEKN